MKIVDKIKASHDKIIEDPDGVGAGIANDLGSLAADATYDGVKSRKWAEYMKNFASNKAQLKRLCGEDPAFNINEWSQRCLAYTVGNSICTIETHRGKNSAGEDSEGTLNYLKPEMRVGLDFGLDSTTGPLS